jgi:hypothetical protein
MEVLKLILAIVLPSAAVLYAMFLTVKAFLNKDFEKRLADLRIKNQELILPARLQAYERICLFLERISPSNLVVRVNNPQFTVGQLHQELLGHIREEFNHNLSQQVYMSDQSWSMTKNAMQDVISIINQAAEGLDREARGMVLAKAILDYLVQLDQEPVGTALTFVKNEIRALY